MSREPIRGLIFRSAGPTISLRDLRIKGLASRQNGLEIAVNREKLMETTRLARNPHDRWLGGVCGGIARWADWNSDMVRLAYVVLSLLSAAFPGALVYILLWILMPLEE
jgi:phage shock protein PspC (stress-responsive transcriptional regulator)